MGKEAHMKTKLESKNEQATGSRLDDPSCSPFWYAAADNERWSYGLVRCGIKSLVPLLNGETRWFYLATEAGKPKEWPTKEERDEALRKYQENDRHG